LSATSNEEIMKEWSVDEVCHWLSSVGINSKDVAILKDEEINGYALIKLKEDHLREYGLKGGARINVICKRDDFLQVPPASLPPSVNAEVDMPEVLSVDTNFSDRGRYADRLNLSDCTFEAILKEADVCETSVKSSCADINTTSSEHLTLTDTPVADVIPVISDKLSFDFDFVQPDEFQQVCNEFLIDLPSSKELRAFDTPVQHYFKYSNGTQLTCIESRPGGNLLEPIH
jgi:hypothetical protein